LQRQRRIKVPRPPFLEEKARPATNTPSEEKLGVGVLGIKGGPSPPLKETTKKQKKKASVSGSDQILITDHPKEENTTKGPAFERYPRGPSIRK